MADGREHLNAMAMRRALIMVLGGALDREDLAGDGLGILHPGEADVLARDVQLGAMRLTTSKVRLAGLLDLAVDVLALAGGLVERDLLDEEVFGTVLDVAADAGEVRGEIRQLHMGAESTPAEPITQRSL